MLLYVLDGRIRSPGRASLLVYMKIDSMVQEQANYIPESMVLDTGTTFFPSSLDDGPWSSSGLDRGGSSVLRLTENMSDEVEAGSEGTAVVGVLLGGGGGRDLSRWTPGAF